jgi:hypothetical protein
MTQLQQREEQQVEVAVAVRGRVQREAVGGNKGKGSKNRTFDLVWLMETPDTLLFGCLSWPALPLVWFLRLPPLGHPLPLIDIIIAIGGGPRQRDERSRTFHSEIYLIIYLPSHIESYFVVFSLAI